MKEVLERVEMCSWHEKLGLSIWCEFSVSEYFSSLTLQGLTVQVVLFVSGHSHKSCGVIFSKCLASDIPEQQKHPKCVLFH